MGVQRMDHVGIVVDDLQAAIGFFAALGLELVDETAVEGRWVDRIVGLDGVRSDIAMMQTPDGQQLELTRFQSPEHDRERSTAPANAPGLRHLTFRVDDIDATLAALSAHGAALVGSVENYEDRYRLCYIRGPADIIVELAQQLG